MKTEKVFEGDYLYGLLAEKEAREVWITLRAILPDWDSKGKEKFIENYVDTRYTRGKELWDILKTEQSLPLTLKLYSDFTVIVE